MTGCWKLGGTKTGIVKAALDHLPSGICFFDRYGIPVLCNHQMHRLTFEMIGYDLQCRQEWEAALEAPSPGSGIVRCGNYYRFPTGEMWEFHTKDVTDSEGEPYLEVTAFDVTQLVQRQEELREKNDQQKEIMKRLIRISENAVSIVRSEEILAMKMQLHNDLGAALADTRHFLQEGCPAGEKAEYIRRQKAIAKALLGETAGTDEADAFSELMKIANMLDMRIAVDGTLPAARRMRDLLASVVRECLINAARHAGGNEVYVKLETTDEMLRAEIKNNGMPPKGEIVWGGGLTSLLRSIEQAGGTMEVRSQPDFLLIAELPIEKEKEA